MIRRLLVFLVIARRAQRAEAISAKHTQVK